MREGKAIADRHDVGAADVVRAAALAGVVSGAPSTVHALATGRSPVAALRAAATLLPGRRSRSPLGELAAGVVVHAGLSLGWATVLTAVLPQRRTALWGAAAGAVITALDLGVIGRHNRAIAQLPWAAQVADHVLFGAVVGSILSRRRWRD